MEALINQNKLFSFFSELFIRLVCLVFLFVFVDTFFQYSCLIGENGYSPSAHFLKANYAVNGLSSVFKFPGLFWISASNTFMGWLLVIAAVASLLGFLGIYTPLNIGVVLLVWLSFINSGSDFFIYIWDTFLFEAGIIALIVSLLNHNENYFRFLKFILLLLVFRLWFSMGFVTITYNNTVPINGSFMKYFFQNQPMPTNLSFYMYHLPDWFHVMLSWMLLFIELIVPFFIFFKRLRPLAFVLFTAFSIGIQVCGNFAWFNILSIFVCLPLLMDSSVGQKLFNLLSKIPLKRIHFPMRFNRPFVFGFACFQAGLQVLLLLFLLCPLGNRYLNFLNYYNYQPEFVRWKNKNLLTKAISFPIDLGANFKLANPYGVFKGIPVKRWEIEFQFYNDTLGNPIKTLAWQYKPGLTTNSSFFAPHFPRLEQQLFYESQQGSFGRNYTPFANEPGLNCWTQQFIQQLKTNGELSAGKSYPTPQTAPYPKLVVSELSFNSKEAQQQTGIIWQRKQVFAYFIKDSSINCPLIPDVYFSKFSKHESK